MTLFQLILLPFTLLYTFITDIRNWLYEKGYKKSTRFAVPVICVGNLSVGGTGKTPHVEYLIRLLKDRFQIAVLSRGYGRQTKGFIHAAKGATAAQIGDEPMQFFTKFPDQVYVAVGEKRAEAIPKILAESPGTEVIILDDAYQHRAVNSSFSILLTDYNKPFYRDLVLPAGRLRERRVEANRADIIIISKCPDTLTQAEADSIQQKIRQYARPEIPVFFTGIRYGKPVAFGSAKELTSSRVLLVSGLANPELLEKQVQSSYLLLHHLVYKDHHNYTMKDVLSIHHAYQKCGAQSILVSEKDYVKLHHPALASVVNILPFFYLPIEVHFLLDEQEAFNKKVMNAIIHPQN